MYNGQTMPSLKDVTVLILAILILIHNFSMYLNREIWFIISGVNLIFHEAGHMFMMFFGEFLNIFGGTLFEMGIPLLIAFHFYRRYDWLGVAFSTWWLSTALTNISIYASDATIRQLPLLGGDAVGHDWYNLLSMLGILKYDQVVGFVFLLLSIFSFLGSLYSLWHYRETYTHLRTPY